MTDRKLILNQQVAALMEEHAELAYPNECCGFFFGKNDGTRLVTAVRKVTNAKEGDQRRRFEIAPEDYQKAEKYALDQDLDLLGVYHSHPDHPAEPSEHDRSVALPYFSYIILSVQNGKSVNIRSWQLNEERMFEEEEIKQDEEYSKTNIETK